MILALAVLFALPVSAQATTPFIHAHRGGALVDGTPTFGENTLPAFRDAAAKGFVLELDVKLTQDNVPVVIHDPELDRVTACTGEVAARTLAQLASCPVDIIGTEGNSAPAPDPQPIPTLEQVLDLAREQHARVNIEIKNQPGDPDFDAGSTFANRVMDGVVASKIPGGSTIIQSFWPPNLEVAQTRFPAAETSYLQLGGLTAGGIALAKNGGYEWVSSGGATEPMTAAAHTAGRRVVPYTLDSAADIKAAAAAGVDELISNDPTLARRALAEVDAPAPAVPAAPSDAECERVRAKRTLPAVEAYDPGPQAPRVFAIQFKQEVRHIETYATFRTKMECLVREFVLPRLARGRPNVVALNEDVGLFTIATGSRGRAAREAFAGGSALTSLNAVAAAYAPVTAAYGTRFTSTKAFATGFYAATDTFVRGWMQVFSDLSKRYGVYMLGANNQARFRESTNASEVAQFRDPDIATPRSVYVALDDRIYNEVFMWAPQDRLSEGPRMLRNVVTQNRKVPLTDFEQALQFTPGPSTGGDAVENLRPYALPGSGARISFATSLPAFTYGPAGGDPCADTSKTYMRCMDSLGANLVMQDEANNGRWATDVANGSWQPLEWMTSTWRAASDPSVGFTYNVTPHLVGNLADLPFDGQTAITQRGLRSSPGCNYVGNTVAEPGDERYQAEQGPKSEFLAILPWVTPDGPRSELKATGAKLVSGSRDPLENDYAEGVIAADLPFPANPNRAGCVKAATAEAKKPKTSDDDSSARRRPANSSDPTATGTVSGSNEGSLPFTGWFVPLVLLVGLLLTLAGRALKRAHAQKKPSAG